ncbi:hypothetical protein [Streptomyces sp. NPDC056713]|uniref:hypothetical protein n=1 Tax=Streptomyces sp. NPDC056713 TaxID=3345921 RepID=UPI00369334C0
MRNMLSYLAAALPSPTSSQARLLALQCALRADDLGRAELSSGFLRGMRLLGADAGQVARSSGLTGHQLITALTQLATVGVLTAWTLDTTMDDLARQTVRR